MIMTIDIKNLRDAALRAKSAAEQYANGEISPTEFSRQCSEFNSLTDSPDQILAILDEIGGASALATLMKINARELLKEAEAKDARIAEMQESNAQVIHSRDHYKHISEELMRRIHELQSRAEAAESIAIAVKQFDEFQICHYGATEDYAKGYIDCQNNYNKALSVAGIQIQGGE